MQKTLVAFSCLFLCLFSTAQEIKPIENFVTPLAASRTLTCRADQTIIIPHAVFERAKQKARLIELLKQSIFDDAQGKLDVSREKEIKKLFKELR